MIEQKLEQYRTMYNQLRPLLNKLEKVKQEIKEEVLSTGDIPEVEGVTVQIRKGYKRSTWDNLKLRGYSVVHPEILEFVKEKTVNPTVSIKVEES